MATFNLTANGDTPVSINSGHKFSVAASGTLDGTLKAQYATAAPVAATLTTSLTGDDNDLVFTAVDAGTQGNSLTVAYEDPSASDTALSASFDGTDLVVTLATDSGDAATVTLDSTNAEADLDVTADTAGATGNTYSVELVDPSANDATLSVSTTDYLKFTVSLATGAGGAITSTADEVIAALNAYAPFAALMTASRTSGQNGTGVVEAIAETSLTGGGDNYAITTTAAEIATLVNASDSMKRHLTAANAAANDGTGVVTALSETALSGGTDGTFTEYQSGGTGDLTAAGELELRNYGEIDTINLNLSGVTTTDLDVVVLDLGRI